MMRLTPEAQARVDAEIRRMGDRGRALHPERYAPDGEPLILWAGSDWLERLNSWRAAHGLPIVERTRQMHALPDPPKPKHVNTYSDERHAL